MSNNIKAVKPLGFPWETQDPFLFCVHHLDFYPKGNEEMGPDANLAGRAIGNDFVIKDGWRMYHGSKVPGFPAHPHRGFETITIARSGMIDHSDSIGAKARFGDGDVQWMTAGRGLQHSEMFPLLKKDEENTMELFQIWLNLPKKNKMVDPYFRMLWSETIPSITSEGVDVSVVAGAVEDTAAPDPTPDSWASSRDNRVMILTIKMAPGSTWTIPSDEEDVNRSLYFFVGDSVTVDGKVFDSHSAIELNAGNEVTIENGDSKAEFLLLQGKPINEPVAQYGPFVMNDQMEIQQAMMDYQQTQFGGWPWPTHENVHEREMGRFAIHADGTEEVK